MARITDSHSGSPIHRKKYGHKRSLGVSALLSALLMLSCSGQPEISTAKPSADTKSFKQSIEIIGPHHSIERYASLGDQVWTSDKFGLMHYSPDLGKTWRLYNTPAKEGLRYLNVADNGKRMVLLSETGKYYVTDDAGVKWRQQDLTALASKKYSEYWGVDIGEMAFDSRLTQGVVIIGCEVFQTNDGGMQWKNRSKPLLDDNIDNCVERTFINDQGELAYALVYFDAGYGSNSLFKSMNNGKSWTDICPHSLITTFDQVDPICPEDVESPNAFNMALRYYAIRQDDTPFSHDEIFEDKSMRITDELIDKYNLYLEYSAFRQAGKRIWYNSGDNLAYTDNHGQHWHTVKKAIPYYNGRVFGTASRAVVFDSERYKLLTLDDSKNPTKDISPGDDSVRSVGISDTNILYAGTPQGLYSSTDLGRSWNKVAAVTHDISQLFVSDETIWALDVYDDSHLYWSNDAGASWQYQLLSINYLNVSHCNAEACLLYNEDVFVIASIPKNSSDKPMLSVVKHPYRLPEDHWAEWVFASPNLKIVTVLTDESLLMQTDNYGKQWHKMDISRGYEAVHFSQSPNRLSQLLINTTEVDDYAYDDSDSKLNYLKMNRNSEPQLFSFPEPNSHVNFYSDICWLNDFIALITIHRNTAENGLLTLATTDGGMSWAQTDFNYTDVCVHYPDKVLVGNTYVRVKPDS